MNSMEATKKVEAEGKRRLAPYLREQTNGQFVAIEGTPLALALQTIAKTGDYAVNFKEDRLDIVELKTEWAWTGNVVIETWSNYKITPGWLYTLHCQFIIWQFLENDACVAANWPVFKPWVLPRLERLTEKHQKKYEQANDTVFRLLRAKMLLSHLAPAYAFEFNLSGKERIFQLGPPSNFSKLVDAEIARQTPKLRLRIFDVPNPTWLQAPSGGEFFVSGDYSIHVFQSIPLDGLWMWKIEHRISGVSLRNAVSPNLSAYHAKQIATWNLHEIAKERGLQ